MAANAFGSTQENIISTWLSGKTLKAMLVGSGYTPDFDLHDFRDDVTGEIVGTGYTAGGVALANVAVTRDAATNRIKLTASNVDFGVITATGITGLVVYVSSGSAATDRLYSFHSFASQSPNGVNFTYQWSTDGIGYLTY